MPLGPFLRSLSRRPFPSLLDALERRIAGELFRLPLYPLTLQGGSPKGPAHPLPVPRTGDPERGRAMQKGEFAFAGTTVRTRAPLWRPVGVPDEWLAGLHGFAWLHDLRAGGESEADEASARTLARTVVGDWIARHRRIDGLPFRADVLGARVDSWVREFPYLCEGADPAFAASFRASLARQARHLLRAPLTAPPGAPRIRALRGALAASASWFGRRKVTENLTSRLVREIAVQILADGGHVERNPSRHLATLADLLDARDVLEAAGAPVPDALTEALLRAARMLRFFRHGDGRLALFHGGFEEEGKAIDAALARCGGDGEPAASAPASGFERLACGEALAILDAGAPPPHPFDGNAHASSLSFEFGCGAERIVVNEGAYGGSDAEWQWAMRTTAAHSTVAVDDRSSSEILRGGGTGRRPREVSCRRREEDGATVVEAAHDGYRSPPGIVHTRRLRLAADGSELGGEDLLTGRRGREFAARFHLHPSVDASLLPEGNAALLRTASGAGWRFRASGGIVSLSRGVYLGTKGEIRRAEQIVVSGPLVKGNARVTWAFRWIA